LYDRIEREAVAIRPGLPEARNRAVHEARIPGAQLVPAHADALGDARREVLDHDVGRVGELLRDAALLRVLEIQREAALAAVGRIEIVFVVLGAPAVAPDPAQLVAVERLFELHDVGAHVGQHERAVRPGDDAGEIEHPHAGERLGQRGLRHAAHRPFHCGLRFSRNASTPSFASSESSTRLAMSRDR
jgi:hypothetical protein